MFLTITGMTETQMAGVNSEGGTTDRGTDRVAIEGEAVTEGETVTDARCTPANVYEFLNDGIVFICGDFNSRCSDHEDYICGVDNIPERNVVDFTSNAYGDLFIDFLINTNMCMLNGRNFTKNDFTSISSKGSSVVDYCIIPHEKLDIFSEISMLRVMDVINNINNVPALANTSLPDHSILSWKLTCNISNACNYDKCNVQPVSFDKFDVTDVPNTFLSDQESILNVNRVIEKLERSQQTQCDVDAIFSNWCEIVKNNMYKSLPFVKIGGKKVRKKRRPGKPWWSNTLTELWNDMCGKERRWLNCTNRNEKLHLKSIYVSSRRVFDREVQRAKRLYWFSLQNGLLNDCNVDCNSFWKSIGKIGIANAKSNQIPLEIVLEDGSVSTNIQDVLNRWKHDFSSLFDNVNIQPQSTESDNQYNDESQYSFNESISVLEVKKAVESANLGKACGIDNIPVEVLRNDISIYFLHVLYNVCFNSGVTPVIWNKCIINPIPKSATADPRNPLSYRGISLTSAMYKIYCMILNARLSTWAENYDKLEDEQNGFRKKT
ncbi:uncharacterized protein LOC128558364 [Mercenaria mercenaria]|uniref:uncharacterized protein LOC128558364 n=1 Tax=Mercenaria mercenaria TaxID=6596 RepID=UPI00234F2766|nr:uncharacterized protein LOC128558364 [Mercenaria mercenaria]